VQGERLTAQYDDVVAVRAVGGHRDDAGSEILHPLDLVRAAKCPAIAATAVHGEHVVTIPIARSG
jgi:hypothetical protein